MKTRKPLEPGTVISYRGEKATVVEDNGDETLLVNISGVTGWNERWAWELDGYVCQVISVPGATRAINQQTPGPLEIGNDQGETFVITAECRDICTVETYYADGPANARLLAVSYTMLDRAGRELGIDAAELAERIDLASLLRAVAGPSDEEIRQWIDANDKSHD